MKKFLLLLSCFLATWCSVQAGLKYSTSGSEFYGMSQSASMLLASAPAADPAPTTYPAVIKSATHDPKSNKSDKGVIKVTYTVNTAGYVAFDLETASGRKTNQNRTYRNKGTYSDEIVLKSDWSLGSYVSLMISVDGGICGGIGVPIIPTKPSVKINAVTHDVAKGTVIVDYSAVNPNSETCRLKVFVEGSSSAKVNKVVPAGSNKYSLAASLFEEKVIYRVEVYCGSAKSVQNFTLYSEPSGYISDVKLSGNGANNLPTLFTLDYNLKNAAKPYLYIKRNNAYGAVAKTVEINNTNGVNKSISFTNICSALAEDTWYTACLYDGTKDLCIYHDFKMPKGETYIFDFECRSVSNTQFVIIPSQKIPSSFKQVKVWVYRIDPVTNSLSYQYTATGDPKKNYYVGVPINTNYYYKIILEWPNGERKEKTMLYNTNF